MNRIFAFSWALCLAGILGCASTGLDSTLRRPSSDPKTQASAQKLIGYADFAHESWRAEDRAYENYQWIDSSYDRSRLIFVGVDAASGKKGLISTSIADGTSKVLLTSPDPAPDLERVNDFGIYFKVARASNRIAVVTQYWPWDDKKRRAYELAVYPIDGSSAPQVIEHAEGTDLRTEIRNLMISSDGNAVFYTIMKVQRYPKPTPEDPKNIESVTTTLLKFRDLREKKSVVVKKYDEDTPDLEGIALTDHFALFAEPLGGENFRFLEFSRTDRKLRKIVNSAFFPDGYAFRKESSIIGALPDATGVLLKIDGQSVQKVILPKPAPIEGVVFAPPFQAPSGRGHRIWYWQGPIEHYPVPRVGIRQIEGIYDPISPNRFPITDGERYFIFGEKSVDGQKKRVLAAVEIASGKTQLIYDASTIEQLNCRADCIQGDIRFLLVPGTSEAIVIQENGHALEAGSTRRRNDEIWRISTGNTFPPSRLWPNQTSLQILSAITEDEDNDGYAAPRIDQQKTLWFRVKVNGSNVLASLNLSSEVPIPRLQTGDFFPLTGSEFQMSHPDQLLFQVENGIRLGQVDRNLGVIRWLGKPFSKPWFVLKAAPSSAGRDFFVHGQKTDSPWLYSISLAPLESNSE